jgi:hypothetical protein
MLPLSPTIARIIAFDDDRAVVVRGAQTVLGTIERQSDGSWLARPDDGCTPHVLDDRRSAAKWVADHVPIRTPRPDLGWVPIPIELGTEEDD